MRFASIPCILACVLIVTPGRGQDPDGDGDGLSDYQEVHKYGSDPAKFSTAGDGVGDGDWQRRREFSYTIRSVIKVMPPVDATCINDDYQDARVLAKGDGFVELEVVHYPLNTNAEAIVGDPDWRQEAAGMGDYLRPGLTTNWDERMRTDLIAALKADGIDPDRLDDKELVARVSRWLFAHSKFINSFCTYYVHFPDGRAAIYPELEGKFSVDKGRPEWTTQDQFDHELFGRSMFDSRTHGTCTSSAVYLTTVLRALGVPTRMVLAIPVVDASDPKQLAMVRDRVGHHRVRGTVRLGLAPSVGYFSAHTFNEVYVGRRWVRLNYAAVGQNTLDAHYFGLMTHVNTFKDLSDAPLAETWGKRYALGERDSVFRTPNPYKAEDLSDHFGTFARIENPEAGEHRAITIGKAYWLDSPEGRKVVRTSLRRARPGAGIFLIHGEEWFDGQPYQQYRLFMDDADPEFRLQAEGRADVHCRLSGTYITSESQGRREFEIVITPEDFKAMEPGVDYALKPRNEVPGYQWKALGPITIRRPS